ncbi:MAG: response regulator transcription factor [Chloroflexi bacterium]|nr:response regulator transcription factor [Chloroflexota bacterium]
MIRASILVVDDEKIIRTVITEALKREGYGALAACDAGEALRLCEQNKFDLALIDLKMPGKMDGIGLLQEIHRRWITLPVIVLTGYGTLDSAIAAIRNGAIDYIPKPAELLQIVQSVQRGLEKGRQEAYREQVIRRLEEIMRGVRETWQPNRHRIPSSERFIKTSSLAIDRYRRIVMRNGTEIALTDTEFELLEFLIRHSDQVLTAQELLQGIQGYTVTENEARPIVRVQIQRLRRKLEEDPDHPRHVLTVRGRGYRIVG